MVSFNATYKEEQLIEVIWHITKRNLRTNGGVNSVSKIIPFCVSTS